MLGSVIIEILPKSDGTTVQAGIVVRDGHGFRFYAATHAFNSLESQLFESPNAVESAALCHTVGWSMLGCFGSTDVGQE